MPGRALGRAAESGGEAREVAALRRRAGTGERLLERAGRLLSRPACRNSSPRTAKNGAYAAARAGSEREGASDSSRRRSGPAPRPRPGSAARPASARARRARRKERQDLRPVGRGIGWRRGEERRDARLDVKAANLVARRRPVEVKAAAREVTRLPARAGLGRQQHKVSPSPSVRRQTRGVEVHESEERVDLGATSAPPEAMDALPRGARAERVRHELPAHQLFALARVVPLRRTPGTGRPALPSTRCAQRGQGPSGRIGPSASSAFLARTMRCAAVGSGTRSARATSRVERPTSVRSVSATCASARAPDGRQQQHRDLVVEVRPQRLDLVAGAAVARSTAPCARPSSRAAGDERLRVDGREQQARGSRGAPAFGLVWPPPQHRLPYRLLARGRSAAARAARGSPGGGLPRAGRRGRAAPRPTRHRFVHVALPNSWYAPPSVTLSIASRLPGRRQRYTVSPCSVSGTPLRPQRSAAGATVTD